MLTALYVYSAICALIFAAWIVTGLIEDYDRLKNPWRHGGDKFGYNLFDGAWKKFSFFWLFTLLTSVPFLNLLVLLWWCCSCVHQRWFEK